MSSPSQYLWPGKPEPLGATFDGNGVNFAVYSERATGVSVCLFDPNEPGKEISRIPLSEQTDRVWHGYLPGVQPGTLYGFRAEGPWEPAKGLRFNAKKLLVDPYAKALFGKVDFRGPVLGHRKGGTRELETIDEHDDGGFVPKSVVIDSTSFDWGGDLRPAIPWNETILYEVHVKGFTALHPEVPKEIRGTYAGFAHPAAISHLHKLGITTVELLPIHEAVDEGFLRERGLCNYWGYNSLSFFAPDQRFSHSGTRGEQVNEFKWMVKALHAAQIEVVLDVVYNHTGEGNQLGPTLSLRGLDNPSYYHLKPEDPHAYLDFTGCGNTLHCGHPQTLKLVLDSLRYWVEEMHVDGFRFDLATALARPRKDFDRFSPFLQAVHQDPVLSKVKLIAEPWDVGEGGYQVGGFPVRWAEWNGKYRDSIRKYWRGDESLAGEIALRLSGSADLYQTTGRKPYSSINFITAHDGFTLHDLVSYNQKHNEANKEDNRDGTNDNASWNCGVEGETNDPKINAIREQQKRNFIATLFLSQGVPMLVAGDEMGRTQKGNNNAYCQDNEISYLNWNLGARQKALLDFTSAVIRLRKEQPVFHRRRFFRGAHFWDSAYKDLAWFKPDGTEMTKDDWGKPFVRALGLLLGGDAIFTPGVQGERVRGDTFLVLLNAHHDGLPFRLPAGDWGGSWELVFDTAGEGGRPFVRTPALGAVQVSGRSVLVLKR